MHNKHVLRARVRVCVRTRARTRMRTAARARATPAQVDFFEDGVALEGAKQVATRATAHVERLMRRCAHGAPPPATGWRALMPWQWGRGGANASAGVGGAEGGAGEPPQAEAEWVRGAGVQGASELRLRVVGNGLAGEQVAAVWG